MNNPIKVYHTCEDRGSKLKIVQEAPYRSDINPNSFLGRGYYFWHESEQFAIDWEKKRNRYKSIFICEVELLNQMDDCLDLTRSMDQDHFKALIALVKKHKNIDLWQRSMGQILDTLNAFARVDSQFFPFIMVRILDETASGTPVKKKLSGDPNKPNFMIFGRKGHIICLYDKTKGHIHSLKVNGPKKLKL